jgi:hypothetical protein
MIMNIDTELPGWVRDNLAIPPSDNSVNGEKSDFGNWACLSNSFQGQFATPAPGTIEFAVGTRENHDLLRDYLSYMGERTGIPLTPLEQGAPLYPFFAQVIASEDSSRAFLGVLRTLGADFTLDQAIAHWAESGLPEPYAWKEASDEYVAFARHIATRIGDYYAANLKLREYRWQSGHIVHDHRQYLLFGQNTDQITSVEWFQAAWSFVQRFRVNFGMFVTEALIYDRVTIIGSQNIEVPVTESDEQFLRESGERDGSGVPSVERLEVNSPGELAEVLAARIEESAPFGGYDSEE